MRNNNIILSKGIKLDKSYNNCLTLSSEELLEVLRSESHYITSASDFSFIRSTGRISTPFTYSQCLSSNYIAFQNPDYDNKWFFAWVDNVVYKSDRCTEIEYTIDYFSTWWDNWARTTCMVEREHPTDDSVGNNTQPEPVQLGADYVCTNTGIFKLGDTGNSTMYWGMLVTGGSDKKNPSYSDISVYNGVVSGLHAVMGIPCTDTASIMALVKPYIENGVENRIVRMFQYPKLLGDAISATRVWSGSMQVPSNTEVDGYIPRNNKLLTFPYKYLRISTTDGDTIDLHFELFNDGAIIIKGTLFPTSQFKAYPKNYGGVEDDYTKAVFINTDIEVAWTGDAYKQWLANSKVSEGLGFAVKTIGNIGQIVAGGSTGNAAMIASGTIGLGESIVSVVNDVTIARNQSSKVHSSQSGNGLAIAEGSFGFIIQVMSIRSEYAKIIDDFFDKYGYATNKLKKPNFYGRTNNYVKISSDSVIGFGEVPAADMNIINGIFRKGVTLYHSHDSIGTY